MRALAVFLFTVSIGLGLVIYACVRFLFLAFKAQTSGSGDIITFFCIRFVIVNTIWMGCDKDFQERTGLKEFIMAAVTCTNGAAGVLQTHISHWCKENPQQAKRRQGCWGFGWMKDVLLWSDVRVILRW